MARLDAVDPSTDTGPGADLLNGPLKEMQINIFKGLASHPDVLQAFLGWSGGMKGGALTPLEHEMLALHISETNGCAYCGADAKLTLDHVVALNDGGLHVPSNLVGACGSCNSSKQDSPVEQWFKAQPFFSEQRWQRIQKITGQGQLSLV